MKKILLIITFVLLLCGCEKKIEPFYLEDSYYTNEAKLITKSSDDINQMSSNKENFAVFVYMNGCISCMNFEDILNEYTKEYNVSLNSISYQEIDKTDISKYVKYSPSVVIYKEGKIIAYLDATCNEDIPCYETVEGFHDWFSKYVLLK